MKEERQPFIHKDTGTKYRTVVNYLSGFPWPMNGKPDNNLESSCISTSTFDIMLKILLRDFLISSLSVEDLMSI
jgi:hypothetical protein